MGGGLMQLVAYGAQDVYLSGNPQITFFKVVYRRHTNFAVEPIQQTWNGASDFSKTVTCNINRNGDLITNMYISIILKNTQASLIPWGYVNRLGHAIIEDVKIEIGGSKIDEHYGDWLNIWYELTHKSGQERGYAKMIGDIPSLTNISTLPKNSYQLYIPLQFWFNRNNGLALPLIALQYHDVRITLKFRSAIECINYEGKVAPQLPEISDSYLLIDYVYLDSEERKRFAQASHEYLIEQLQFTGSETITGTSSKYRLNFNHPSKYLIWAPHLEKYHLRQQWLAFSSSPVSWSQARDRFAKLLYLATRSHVFGRYTEVNNVRQFGVSDTFSLNGPANNKIYVERPPSALASGDIFESVNVIPDMSPIVYSLLDKIEIKFIAQEDIPPDTNPSFILVANGTGNNDSLLDELLNNTIVIKNELTSEDISYTITELTNFKANSNILDLGIISAINYHNYGNFVDGTDNPVYNAKLQLNGHDRFQQRDGNYFNYVQPYQHFSNTPADGINVYSFALKAEDHQPTGSCNFSRIDNATLQVDFGKNNLPYPSLSSQLTNSNSILNIYTVNYNVLRVMSGMAGPAYSN